MYRDTNDTPPLLTPYDTGKRAEPFPWLIGAADTLTYSDPKYQGDYEEAFGRVDFDNDEGETIATVYVERNEAGGYTLHIEGSVQRTLMHLVIK